jgi:HlyD family secretion protein
MALRLSSRLLVLATVALCVVGAAYFGWKTLGAGGKSIERPLSVLARRATLRVIVTERGNLESMLTVDGICELNGMQNKIIQIVPEGTKVKKGQTVVKFDTSEIEKNIAQQDIKSKQAKARIETTAQEIEIARNKGEGEEKDAEVEFKLAKGNLEKYVKSDYLAEIADIKGLMAQNESKAEEAKTKYQQTKELVKKGFRSPEQERGAKTEFEQFAFFFERDKEKLKSKEQFEFQLKKLELTSKVEQADGKMKRSKATAKASVAKAQSEYDGATATFTIEDQQLKEYLKQKGLAEIKAEQEGIVAYANDRWYDESSRIREGATVYPRQKIFTLPDMTKMQVKVNIHESLVKKVKPGQKADIRVDAFPNEVLTGVVKTVSQLADSNMSFMRGGSKEYSTIVTVEKLPEEGLKPGMTAEVRIQVGLLPDVLSVPLQAVVEHKGEHYAFVEDKKGAITLRKVKIGESNDKDVQILGGLSEGDRVVLDARTRAEVEFKGEIDKEKDEPKPVPPSPGGAPGGPG